MSELKTHRDVQDQGAKDGRAYCESKGDSIGYVAEMRAKGREVCGLNLIAQGHYETGFENAIMNWEDGN